MWSFYLTHSLLLLLCCLQTVQSDSRCEASGGRCQYTRASESPCTGSYLRGLCNGPKDRMCCVSGTSCRGVIARAAWGAKRPRSISRMRTPVGLVFIHHTAGASCSSSTLCRTTTKNVQKYHMNTRGYSDVGYNFLVGGDGLIYEGRGWDRVGAHTRWYNRRAIAISFMGNFQDELPTRAAVRAAQNLIACGVRQGKLSSTYQLYGHRKARGASTACPGNRLYASLRGWDNFRSGTAP